jgi:hypothetical protein
MANAAAAPIHNFMLLVIAHSSLELSFVGSRAATR